MPTMRSVTILGPRRGLRRRGAGSLAAPRHAPAIVTAMRSASTFPTACRSAILGGPCDRLEQGRPGGPDGGALGHHREHGRRRGGALVDALEDRDFIAKVDLAGLPAGQRIFYEVSFLDLGDLKSRSRPVGGSFVTPPARPARRPLRLVRRHGGAGLGHQSRTWAGADLRCDARVEPDFFIHSGDTIYADGPLRAEVATADWGIWRNVTIPEKEKVAETLHEFRMNYAYNLMDENLRRFNAAVPIYAQWDDHEVTDNWYWELRKDPDKRYKEGSVALLAARAMRAFHDYQPPACTRWSRTGSTPASAMARRSRCSGSTCAPTVARTTGPADRAQPRGADHRRAAAGLADAGAGRITARPGR